MIPDVEYTVCFVGNEVDMYATKDAANAKTANDTVTATAIEENQPHLCNEGLIM
jgi:hypothetical protein